MKSGIQLTMSVEELLTQLEGELIEVKESVKARERDYNDAIDLFSNRGTVMYFYGQYERSIRDAERLQLAINVIKERYSSLVK